MTLAITESCCITAVGHSTGQTTAAVRAGISNLIASDTLVDRFGEPVITGPIFDIGLADDPYDQTLCCQRLANLADIALDSLVRNAFSAQSPEVDHVYLLLGGPYKKRPGQPYVELNNHTVHLLVSRISTVARNVDVEIIPFGNASLMYAIEKAQLCLQNNPDSLCIIGGIDSLITYQFTEWLEESERLKTPTFGRNHGLPPGEAVSFLLVESKKSMGSRRITPQAFIIGVGTQEDNAPFESEKASIAEGLTLACRKVLDESKWMNQPIDVVISDMNGEYHRAKEWSYVEHRCLAQQVGQLWHPAEAFGDIGAASGFVHTSMAAFAIDYGWFKNALIVSSDDYGPCGALFLQKHI